MDFGMGTRGVEQRECLKAGVFRRRRCRGSGGCQLRQAGDGAGGAIREVLVGDWRRLELGGIER